MLSGEISYIDLQKQRRFYLTRTVPHPAVNGNQVYAVYVPESWLCESDMTI